MYVACRTSVAYETLEPYLPDNMHDHIQLDVETFRATFRTKKGTEWSKFVRVNGTARGSIWIYTVGTNHINLSSITAGYITAWGFELTEEPPIVLTQCQNPVHYQHDYLVPFHKTNPELQIHYNKIIEGDDDERKERIRGAHRRLQDITNREFTITHEHTEFHCYGKPLKSTDYVEDEWIVRLYQSFKDNVGNDVNVVPSFDYRTNFSDLQEKFSTCGNTTFFSLEVPQI